MILNFAQDLNTKSTVQRNEQEDNAFFQGDLWKSQNEDPFAWPNQNAAENSA